MITKHIQDPKTGEMISLIPVTHWYKGTLMEDSFCDEIIYFKGKPEDSDRYYKRYIEDHINVKWFGAMGDGSDATANIQQAFNYLIDLRNYRHISKPSYDLCCFIPDGKYKIENTLLFPTSCTLKGESTNGTVLFTNRNDISILFPSEKGDVFNNRHNRLESDPYTNIGEEFTTISDLTLAGPHYRINPYVEKGALGTNNSGVLIKDTTKINLKNLFIEGFETSAIYCHESYYTNIDCCTLFNNQIGLLADEKSTTIYVSNTTVRLNAVGLLIQDSFACNFTNTIIESNDANYLRTIDFNKSPYNSRDIGVILKNCQNINFSACYFENNLVTTILDSSHENTFTNCYFCPDNGPLEAGKIQSYLVWFYGKNASDNKFINNDYISSKEELYRSHKFFTQFRNTSTGNVFELTTKLQLDRFISQNQDEFTEYTNNNWKANAPKFFCSGSNEQFIDVERRYITDKTFGSSSERPVNNLYGGQHYFDSTLGKPIYWQGTKWVKSDGTDA